jgi:histone H3/H4
MFPLCLAVQRLGDAEANRVANEAIERINIALKEAAADVFAQKVTYAPQKGLTKVA